MRRASINCTAAAVFSCVKRPLRPAMTKTLPASTHHSAEQRRIVAKVNRLIAFCDRLEASLTARDDTRGRMLDALLHKDLEGDEDR